LVHWIEPGSFSFHTMAQLESSRSYAYDTLNRLTNALVTDSQAWSGLAQSTTTYSYDDLSNRISHFGRGAAAISHGHDKANRMTDPTSSRQF